MHASEKWKWSRSVVSNSSQPYGLQPTRLLCPWAFPGKGTGVGCHCFLHLFSWISIYIIFKKAGKWISSSYSLSPTLFPKCVLTALLAIPPSLLLSSSLPIPWDTAMLKQPVNRTMASGCSSERKSHTLNQKLEMMKVSKEGMLKAETGLLCQLNTLWMQGKSSWRKSKVLLQCTHEW